MISQSQCLEVAPLGMNWDLPAQENVDWSNTGLDWAEKSKPSREHDEGYHVHVDRNSFGDTSIPHMKALYRVCKEAAREFGCRSIQILSNIHSTTNEGLWKDRKGAHATIRLQESPGDKHIWPRNAVHVYLHMWDPETERLVKLPRSLTREFPHDFPFENIRYHWTSMNVDDEIPESGMREDQRKQRESRNEVVSQQGYDQVTCLPC
ncbi:hypothetical protein BDV97DRAFT_353926 [Delphinella strobiligena]|nr:hypothetical protein BDV97DRAFT_353926 [Delphinella strobiligena]